VRCSQYCAGGIGRHFAEVSAASKGSMAAGERSLRPAVCVARQVCGQFARCCALRRRSCKYSRLSQSDQGLAAGYFGALINQLFASIYAQHP